MDPIALTLDLIRIPSPTGQEGAVANHVADLLAGEGWQVTRQELGDGRRNVYAVLDPPVIVFSTHLDVVPPELPVSEDDEWIHGRGSADAKGVAAAMIAAATRLRDAGERRLGLLFLAGEEDGSDGARAAAALQSKGRFLINGEPTDNRLVIGHPGALRVRLHATGRAAHSAYVEKGRSAIHLLLDAIYRIRGRPLPSDSQLGATTVNIGRIEGGVAANVLAPTASADLLYRIVAPAEGIRTSIETAAGPSVEVSFPVEIPPFHSEPLPGWDCTTVRFTTDLPLLKEWGEGYLLGPGSIRVAHTDEERIAKADLLAGVDAYVRLANQLLARNAA